MFETLGSLDYSSQNQLAADRFDLQNSPSMFHHDCPEMMTPVSLSSRLNSRLCLRLLCFANRMRLEYSRCLYLAFLLSLIHHCGYRCLLNLLATNLVSRFQNYLSPHQMDCLRCHSGLLVGFRYWPAHYQKMTRGYRSCFLTKIIRLGRFPNLAIHLDSLESVQTLHHHDQVYFRLADLVVPRGLLTIRFVADCHYLIRH